MYILLFLNVGTISRLRYLWSALQFKLHKRWRGKLGRRSQTGKLGRRSQTDRYKFKKSLQFLRLKYYDLFAPIHDCVSFFLIQYVKTKTQISVHPM